MSVHLRFVVHKTSPASHRESPTSNLCQSIWDLWYTKYRQPLTAKVRLQTYISPFEICGTQNIASLSPWKSDFKLMSVRLRFVVHKTSPASHRESPTSNLCQSIWDLWYTKHRQPLTAKVRLQTYVSPFEICGTQNRTATGFCSSVSVFPCQCHSTNAP